MLFMRVYLDLMTDCARTRADVPAEWEQALEACLANAKPAEREHYLELMADSGLLQAQLRRTPATAPTSREDMDVFMRVASLEEAIEVALDLRARLRPEHLDALVARALKLAETGERRLSEALLARTPMRAQMAPLFLEANAKQRAGILLAAQRAELGRPAPALPTLDAAMADRLEFAAVTGERAEFGKALAEALDIAPELAWRIAEDRGGEPLSLVLASLGAPRDLMVRIVTGLDMRDGETYSRIHGFAGLADKVSPGAVQRIVAAMVGAPTFRSEAPPLAPATSREAASPSPFLRREAHTRPAHVIPETPVRRALNSRRP